MELPFKKKILFIKPTKKVKATEHKQDKLFMDPKQVSYEPL